MDSNSLLDEMINEDSVQILKAALPYLPPSRQPFVSVFAKFLELQNTLHLFRGSSFEPQAQLCAQSQEKTAPIEMLSACSKVCHGALKEQIDSVINTYVMLQMLDLSQKPAADSSDFQNNMQKGLEPHYDSKQP